MSQILILGAWITIVSFVFLKHPFFIQMFSEGGEYFESKHLTAYFVLFILSALFNGFNVRDDKFAIFRRLNENPGFLKVFFAIIIVQAVIVNSGLVPLTVFQWIGEMFSCVPFEPIGWLAVVLLAVTVIPVDLIRKAIMERE